MKKSNPRDPNEHPPKSQHMVSGSAYYRQRADIQRGLHKREFPSDENSVGDDEHDGVGLRRRHK